MLKKLSKLVQELLRLQDDYKPNAQDDLITFGLLLLFIVVWVWAGPPGSP